MFNCELASLVSSLFIPLTIDRKMRPAATEAYDAERSHIIMGMTKTYDECRAIRGKDQLPQRWQGSQLIPSRHRERQSSQIVGQTKAHRQR